MASLIDEALADEPAFREKTARLLAEGLFVAATEDMRGTGVCPPYAITALKRSIAKQQGATSVTSVLVKASDADALRHIEALDAARWARGQLGR